MKVGIIGAGAMGSGIAQVASTANCTVRLFDSSKEALQLSKDKLERIMARLVEKGRITEEDSAGIQARITYGRRLSDLSDSDLVIEAIVENLDIKKEVFAELEVHLTEDAIIATNTSSLPVTALASALERPERFVGIHFFNPAPLMKLVEIIPAIQTDPVVAAHARKVIEGWGKITVMAKDTPGFIVNKVARPFYSEALRILEEGIADEATIDHAMKTIGGFRMGPFELMDFIGHDVNYVVTETVFKAFYYDPRYKPAFSQKRLVEAGFLGRKSGRGFYKYGEGANNPEPSTDENLLKQIFDRILIMLINEAADTLHYHIASAEDIDKAMKNGVNYPKGLLEWADELGIANCVERMDHLYDIYHEDRYRCSPLLRKMARGKGQHSINNPESTSDASGVWD